MQDKKLLQIGEVAKIFHVSMGILRIMSRKDFWNRSMWMKKQAIVIMESVSLKC